MLAADDEVYCRFEQAGTAIYGRVRADAVHALDRAPWLNGHETGVVYPLLEIKLLPPSDPRNILCLANSYAGKEKNPPKFIRWFAKSPSAAATDGDSVEIPPVVDQLKSEVEVVLIVGKKIKNATEAEAHDAIFGYATGNEIFGFPESFQKVNGEDSAHPELMLAAGLKLGDKFTPFGPFIHRGKAWLPRTRKLTVINPTTGKKKEYFGDTAGLLYSPEVLLSELSKVQTIEAGDIIFTGTTQSIIVDPGDQITAEIEGLGALHTSVIGVAK